MVQKVNTARLDSHCLTDLAIEIAVYGFSIWDRLQVINTSIHVSFDFEILAIFQFLIL